jgi:hypothetical protein
LAPASCRSSPHASDPHGRGRVYWHHLAGNESIEQHAHGGELLLYAGELKKGSAYQRNIGPAVMGKLLNALGVQLRIEPVDRARGSINLSENSPSYQQLHRERSRRAGKARIAKMSDQERFSFFSMIGNAGARARAAKHRAVLTKKMGVSRRAS